MMKRSTSLVWGLFVLSCLLLLLLVASAVQGSDGRMLLIAGIVLALTVAVVTGLSVRSQTREATALLRSRSDTELLRTQLAAQGQAIDFLADGLDLAIFICDASGTVSYSNRTARDMFEFTNPTGRSLLAITVSYDLEQLVLGAARTHKLQSRELTFPRPQERNAIAKAWINPETSQVFVSILDVSNLRRLERVRQDFVANVSHELRTPMSIIRAYAETLLDDETPDAAHLQNYLPKMIGEIDRLSGLTRDLLILSAAELEQVQKQRCDIAIICETVVMQLSPKAEGKKIELDYRGPDHCFIEANTSQMTQVILNLVENALNYTVRGSVDVILQCDTNPILITVRDTGIGIASEHAARIFERFYRVDKGRSRSTGGTGLGLSIVKHIVEAHNGKITIESALNEGTVFTVSLPVGTVDRFTPA